MSGVVNVQLNLVNNGNNSSIFLPTIPVDVSRDVDVKFGAPLNLTMNTSTFRNIEIGNAVSVFMKNRRCVSFVVDKNKIIYVVLDGPCCESHNLNTPITCGLIEVERNTRYTFREPHTFSKEELSAGFVLNANVFSFNIKIDFDTINKMDKTIIAEQKNMGSTVALIFQKIGPDIDVYATQQIVIMCRE